MLCHFYYFYELAHRLNLQNFEIFAMCNQLQWLVLAGRHVTVLEYWFVLVIFAIYAFH